LALHAALPIYRDLEAAARELGDAGGQRLGGAVERVEAAREARGEAPAHRPLRLHGGSVAVAAAASGKDARRSCTGRHGPRGRRRLDEIAPLHAVQVWSAHRLKVLSRRQVQESGTARTKSTRFAGEAARSTIQAGRFGPRQCQLSTRPEPPIHAARTAYPRGRTAYPRGRTVYPRGRSGRITISEMR